MNVAIPSEEFVFTNGEKHDMADWNLLLYAIALKQTEIVRYFIEDVGVSIKNFGTRPGDHDLSSDEARAHVFSFPLLLAINNKDSHMLEELLSH